MAGKAPLSADMDVPVPPQDKRPYITDLRNIALGPKGFRVSRKRKLEEQEQQVCPFGSGPGCSRPSPRTQGLQDMWKQTHQALPCRAGRGRCKSHGGEPACSACARQAAKAQHLGAGPGEVQLLLLYSC